MATLDKHDTWQELVLDGTVTIDWEGDTIKVMLITSVILFMLVKRGFMLRVLLVR